MAKHIIKFTFESAQDSDWQDMPSVSWQDATRLPTVYTDSNCPSTTLTIFVRDKQDQVTKAVSDFSLAVGADEAYLPDLCAPIAGLIDGSIQCRLRLGSAPSGDSVVQVRIN